MTEQKLEALLPRSPDTTKGGVRNGPYLMMQFNKSCERFWIRQNLREKVDGVLKPKKAWGRK